VRVQGNDHQLLDTISLDLSEHLHVNESVS
jgi:hypothetical protein